MDQVSLHRNYRPASFRTLYPHLTYLTKKPYSLQFYAFSKRCISNSADTFHTKFITNRSSHPITDHQLNVLRKGLSFIPTPTSNAHIIDVAISQTNHIYNLHKYFHDREPYQHNRTHPFHIRSTWTPPNSMTHPLPPTHDDFRNYLTINHKHQLKPDHNLTHQETQALTSLIRNKLITIKRSDKGGGITILDTDKYIAQIRTEHLSDHATYQPIDHCPTMSISTDTNTLIDFLHTHHHIDSATADFLRPPNPARTPIFYGLPKTHKPNIPFRPIISGFDSPTDNMAKYITHFLSPLAALLPSHFKDSTDFKRYLHTLPPLPPNAYLVTADIVSLYTNIPIEEGISRVCEFISENRHHLPPSAPNTQVFRLILDHILKHNAFSFLGDHFLQILGTAMGCRMAPPYANLFLYHLDCIISGFPNVYYLKRFIDDLFFIFIGSPSSIQKLERLLNSLHPTIKFTLKYSRTTIEYLDLQIYINHHRLLATSLYRKPTDCQAYLHFNSHHPLHVKTGIIYSQALRLNRLIDNDTDLQEHLHILTRALLVQGYPLDTINRNILRALEHSQHDLIYRPTIEQDTTTPFRNTIFLPYCHLSTSYRQFISSFDPPTTLDIAEGTAEPTISRPRINTTFSRSKNIGDLVTHTHTSTPQ